MHKNVPPNVPTDEAHWAFRLYQFLIKHFPASGNAVNNEVKAPTSLRAATLFWIWKIVRLIQRADHARREVRVRLADSDGSLTGLDGTYWLRTFAAKANITRVEASVFAWDGGGVAVLFKVNGDTVETLLLEDNANQAWVNLTVQPGDVLTCTVESEGTGEDLAGLEVAVCFADVA